MGTSAGALDTRVEFFRRARQASVAGNVRGEYELVCRRWARVRPASLDRGADMGQLVEHVQIYVTVRPDEITRQIGAGWRAAVGGKDFAVLAADPVDRVSNSIRIALRSDQG